MDLEVRVDPARDRARLYDGHCHPFSVQSGEGWHARPAKEDRVEPAALTAGSVTLRNGACHFSGLPRPSRQAPNEPRCRNHSQTRPQEPLTVATRSRQLVDLDHRHTAVSRADMRGRARPRGPRRKNHAPYPARGMRRPPTWVQYRNVPRVEEVP